MYKQEKEKGKKKDKDRKKKTHSAPDANPKKFQHYKLSDITNDQLNAGKDFNKLSAQDLLKTIEQLLADGILPESHFIELLSNERFGKDLSSLANRINRVYKQIIRVYADHFTNTYRDLLQNITAADLCNPPKSGILRKLDFMKENVAWYLEKCILGYPSKQAYLLRDQTIPAKRLQYQRTLRFQMWLDIADILMREHNEVSLNSIIFALNGRNLSRLARTIEGLSPRSKQIRDRLTQFCNTIYKGSVDAHYYFDCIEKVPVITDPYIVLGPLRRLVLAENEVGHLDKISVSEENAAAANPPQSEPAKPAAAAAANPPQPEPANQGSAANPPQDEAPNWAKIIRNVTNPDEALRRLLDQHPVYACVVPIWQFLIEQIYNIKSNSDVPDLKVILITPRHIGEGNDELSKCVEPSGEKNLLDVQYVPESLFRLDSPLAPSSTTTGIELLQTWLLENYIAKLVTVNEILQKILHLDNLLKTTKLTRLLLEEYQIDYLTLLDNLHIVNMLDFLGAKHDFKKLGIDAEMVHAMKGLITSLKGRIDEISQIYQGIQFQNEQTIASNHKLSAVQRDLLEFRETVEKLTRRINDFIERGDITELRTAKKSYFELSILVNKSYDGILRCLEHYEVTDQMRANKEELIKQFNFLRQAFIAKEFLYFQHEPTINDIIFRCSQVLQTLSAKYMTDTPTKSLPPKEIKEDIACLNDLLCRLPISVGTPVQASTGDKKGVAKPASPVTDCPFRPATIELIKDLHNRIPRVITTCEDLILLIRAENITLANVQPKSQRANLPVVRKHPIWNNPLRQPMHTSISLDIHSTRIFSAFAKMLNLLKGKVMYDEKVIRSLCHGHYLRNKIRLDAWLLEEMKNINLEKTPYDRVQYTQNDMTLIFDKANETINGHFKIDARILCEALQLSELYFIHYHPEGAPTFYRIHADGCEQIPALDIAACTEARTPLLAWRDGIYHVPKYAPAPKETYSIRPGNG